MPAVIERERERGITNLCVLRKQLGLSQAEFGEQFGITAGYVCKIENGTVVPSEDLLILIAERYEVKKSWLLKKVRRITSGRRKDAA